MRLNGLMDCIRTENDFILKTIWEGKISHSESLRIAQKVSELREFYPRNHLLKESQGNE